MQGQVVEVEDRQGQRPQGRVLSCRGTSGPREGAGPDSTRIWTPGNPELSLKGTRAVPLVPSTVLTPSSAP